jgi:aminoglycoside phosphotransferase (APT) family kinase protein
MMANVEEVEVVVFVDGDEVTGVVDWSEASQGDALFDVARSRACSRARPAAPGSPRASRAIASSRNG